jgi:hypothetical protein
LNVVYVTVMKHLQDGGGVSNKQKIKKNKKINFYIQFSSQGFFSALLLPRGVIFLIILGPPLPRVTTCRLFLKVYYFFFVAQPIICKVYENRIY